MRKKYRDEKIKIGECLDCEQPAEPKKRRCKKHLEYQRAAKEKSRAKKPGGQCADCQETVITGHTRCIKCTGIHREAQGRLAAKRIKAGLCPACGGEKTEEDAHFYECVACKASLNDRR